MNLLSRFRIGPRLVLAFAALLCMLLIVGGAGLWGMNRVGGHARSLYEDGMQPLERLAEINRLVQRNRVLVMDMMARSFPANVEKRDTELQANLKQVDELFARLRANVVDGEAKVDAEAFAEAYRPLVDHLQGVRDAVRQGKGENAEELYEAQLSPQAAKVAKALKELTQTEITIGRAHYEDAQATERRLSQLLAALSVIALLLGALLAWLIARSVVRPLQLAVQAAHAVRDGDLTLELQPRGRDECAQLLQAMQAMRQGLVGTVQAVRGNAESVATASSQIAHGNQDLSGRTEEQASTLQQTAASIEQLGVTVQQNADNAQQAKRLSQDASQIAALGGAAVGKVVSTMRDIESSSQRIADIISVIDGIAFQTNILALNAAVEAARAGEQGRGFAVVASEVRVLAKRSAEAAKEIKSLIVHSVEQVEQGSALVAHAGSTMGEVIDAVQRVGVLIAEISSASCEQSTGIAQVVTSIAELDRTTQQNSALVEESAAATESLSQQARQLLEAVAVFQLEAPAPVRRARIGSNLPAVPRLQPRPC